MAWLIERRAVFTLSLLLASLVCQAAPRADTYPSRQITIMPLLAAGTGLDVAVRLYAEQLSQTLRQAGGGREQAGQRGPGRRSRR